jgi:nucleoside-diphosphate-sugar epimerase
VESYLRLVGTNGLLVADFVRGTVQLLSGPGSSIIDKTLNPYRQARQLLFGTTRSLLLRVAHRQVSYPGLVEIFDAFYRAIQQRGEAPVSADNILSTVSVCERVADALRPVAAAIRAESAPASQRVLVTGGTGFLGAELVRSLVQRGLAVRVLARREPAPWDRVAGVEYVLGDLGDAIPERAAAEVATVVHLAAETAGGFDEHRRNSIDATERILRLAAAAGVRRFVHVSSLAVHGPASDAAGIHERTPLEADARARGPYVWGKLESERLAIRLGQELGIEVKIVRPGAIIDPLAFDPPGRLGRRIGNLFVAVGSPSDRLGIVERGFAASALAWIVEHFEEAPSVLNLLSPELPEKRELVAALQRINPGMRVFWLPQPLLALISSCAVLAQRLLRPGSVPVDVAKVFAVDRFDTAAIRRLSARLEPPGTAAREPRQLAR